IIFQELCFEKTFRCCFISFAGAKVATFSVSANFFKLFFNFFTLIFNQNWQLTENQTHRKAALFHPKTPHTPILYKV
ncbi:MAG: hypothetical protein IKK02_05270, partial [Tidjanibacter sp.]|nr:hypothetical protein [Tidjanibacter sp.]